MFKSLGTSPKTNNFKLSLSSFCFKILKNSMISIKRLCLLVHRAEQIITKSFELYLIFSLRLLPYL